MTKDEAKKAFDDLEPKFGQLVYAPRGEDNPHAGAKHPAHFLEVLSRDDDA
jgi:hypothetical protein